MNFFFTSSSYLTISNESEEKYTCSILLISSCSAWGSLGCSRSSRNSSFKEKKNHNYSIWNCYTSICLKRKHKSPGNLSDKGDKLIEWESSWKIKE